MASKHGKQTMVFLDSSNISAQVSRATITKSCELADDTPFGTSVTTRTKKPGLLDGSVTLEGFWSTDTDSAAFISKFANSKVGVLIGVNAASSGQTILRGTEGYAFAGKYSEFSVEGPVDDIVKHVATISGANSFSSAPESVHIISSAFSGSASATWSTGQSTAQGGALWLFVGPNNTIASTTMSVYHGTSAVNATTLLTTFAVFTSSETATTWRQRKALSGTIRRWIRVVTAGGAGSLQWHVGVHRK